MIVDDEVGNAELSVINFYKKYGKEAPLIVNSLPNNLRRANYLMKLVSLTKDIKYLNKFVLNFVNFYMKLSYLLISEINVDKNTLSKQIILKFISRGLALKLRATVKSFLGTLTERQGK